MIASENVDLCGVFDLKSIEKAYSFDALSSSVYVISEEEVTGIGR